MSVIVLILQRFMAFLKKFRTLKRGDLLGVTLHTWIQLCMQTFAERDPT